MAVSFEQFAAELRAFSGRRAITNEVRKDLRKPLPKLRKEIRRNAMGTLPGTGGLNRWVAGAALRVRLRDSGRSAGISLKLSRKAGDGDKADLDALDRLGLVRHPLYGNRRYWFPQNVPSGFFTDVWDVEKEEFIATADAAMDRALDQIRRG